MNAITQNIAAVLNEIAETQSGSGISFNASFNAKENGLRIDWKSKWKMGEGEASKFHSLPKNDDRILSVIVDLEEQFALYLVSGSVENMKKVCKDVSGDYPRK